jgi:hypothetical protein
MEGTYSIGTPQGYEHLKRHTDKPQTRQAVHRKSGVYYTKENKNQENCRNNIVHILLL